jgi:hypothetical protein
MGRAITWQTLNFHGPCGHTYQQWQGGFLTYFLYKPVIN